MTKELFGTLFQIPGNGVGFWCGLAVPNQMLKMAKFVRCAFNLNIYVGF